MAKTFHKKKDGTVVVKDGGKIVTNLPSARTAAATPPRVPLKKVARAGEYEIEYDNYYEAFKNKKLGKTLAELDADVAHLDANIYAIKKEMEDNPEATYVINELPGIEVETLYEEGSEISGKQAIDVYRLQKAIIREERTEMLIKQDRKDGIERISSYGDGPLGSAIVEGYYETNTKEWLLSRTRGIGGSDKIGFVDEEGKFVSYDSVGKRGYLNSVLTTKTEAHVESVLSGEETKGEEKEQPLPLRIGNAMEKTIQYEFAVNNTQYVHLEDKNTRTADGGRSWHRFNPDGVLLDKETERYGIFEAKTSRDKATFDKALPGYRAQCLHNAAAAGLNFAVLVADIEGSNKQFVKRFNYTDAELQEYRDAVDRVWLLHKPRYDKRKPAVSEVNAA